MKRTISLFLWGMSLSGICAIVGGAIGLFIGCHEYTRPGPLAAPQTVVVEQGQDVEGIANMLCEKTVITDVFVFRMAARLTGKDKKLQAGEYEFPPEVSMERVLDTLADGEVIRHFMTVPEGLTSAQIVGLLNQVEGLVGEISDLPPEGSLLPETYDYAKGQTREEAITRMQEAMEETLDELWPRRVDNLPFHTKEEAVILASIVEKETGVAGERDRIAGVFINRLRQGMKLQADPTAIYALTKGEVANAGMGPLGRRLLKKDLEIDSPYNTYKYAGLPPGPIAHPGRDAIAAVLNPEDHDYLYFVADGTGGHAFAPTLLEHTRNVAEWRKIRKKKGN